MKPEGFCNQCGYVVESFDGLEKCPNCGSTGVPCAYENQVTVDINMHELRLLFIWAENWGSHCGNKDVVYSMASRIRKQLPEKFVKTPLTMAEEFAELKEHGFKFETNHPAADNPETGECYKPDF